MITPTEISISIRVYLFNYDKRNINDNFRHFYQYLRTLIHAIYAYLLVNNFWHRS